MTEPRFSGHSAESAHGTCRPFLTVIARAPLRGEAGPIEHLQELLTSARQLLLFPATGGWELSACCDGYRSALDADATLTLLANGPAGTTLATEPNQWVDAALSNLGCRSDAMGLETTVVVTEDLLVLIPGLGKSQDLQVLCDLSRERFSSAWNRYLEYAAPAATQSRVADVLCEVDSNESGKAGAHDLAKLERQLRELSHERSVLRENRDFAREEHMRELEAHQALNDQNRAKIEANQLELKVRAERIDELLAATDDADQQSRAKIEAHQLELKVRAERIDELLATTRAYREAVESLEGIVRRTRAVRIAKWLDRFGALRRKLPGGGR